MQLQRENLVVLEFKEILTALLQGDTIFVTVTQDMLAMKYEDGALKGCPVVCGTPFDSSNFKRVNIKLEEVLQESGTAWYRYIKYEEIEG